MGQNLLVPRGTRTCRRVPVDLCRQGHRGWSQRRPQRPVRGDVPRAARDRLDTLLCQQVTRRTADLSYI